VYIFHFGLLITKNENMYLFSTLLIYGAFWKESLLSERNIHKSVGRISGNAALTAHMK